MVFDAARIDGRDRRPVAVAEQDAALQPDGVEHVRQHVLRLLMHEGHTPWHCGWAGATVAGTGISEHAKTGRVRKACSEVAPDADRAQPLMQQHEGCGFVRTRSNHLVFELARSDFDEAVIAQIHACSLYIPRYRRWTLGAAASSRDVPDQVTRPRSMT